jgi:membrane protease YdiL (CAAX protease family)
MAAHPPDDTYPDDNGDFAYDDDDLADDEHFDNGDDEDRPHRRMSTDPIFGVLLAGAISIGLIPLIEAGAFEMRYTLSWSLLAFFGVLSWLLGSSTRIGQEKPENLAWGIALGLILGLPLLAFASGMLAELTGLMFQDMSIGALLAYLVFVIPLAETLFFRGVLQDARPFWMTGVICTLWGVVLFFPLVNRGPFPLIVAVILLMANMMYSYVRERNGLAAAWLCQIVVHFAVFFVPFATTV